MAVRRPASCLITAHLLGQRGHVLFTHLRPLLPRQRRLPTLHDVLVADRDEEVVPLWPKHLAKTQVTNALMVDRAVQLAPVQFTGAGGVLPEEEVDVAISVGQAHRALKLLGFAGDQLPVMAHEDIHEAIRQQGSVPRPKHRVADQTQAGHTRAMQDDTGDRLAEHRDLAKQLGGLVENLGERGQLGRVEHMLAGDLPDPEHGLASALEVQRLGDGRSDLAGPLEELAVDGLVVGAAQGVHKCPAEAGQRGLPDINGSHRLPNVDERAAA